MSNKNEVFEYLIDQLRQQVSNNQLRQQVSNNQLRQQVSNNQCEDLAHEVLSLKSELARYKKPYISYVKKTDWVQGDSRFLKKWGKHRADILRECIQEQDAEIQSLKNQLRDASAQIKELHLALTQATGDVEAYKVLRKGGYIRGGQNYVVCEHTPGASVNCRCTPTPVPPEQSGCRKEDVRECFHNWRFVNGKAPAVCVNCGVTKSSECEHEWQFYGVGFPCMCLKCGLKK